MNTFIKAVAGIVIGIGCIVLSTFIFGGLGNVYESTIGLERENIQREQFEESKSYVHGKITDLQRYRREYMETNVEEDKKVIINIIQDEFANFDPDKIDNDDLRKFLEDVMNGGIK